MIEMVAIVINLTVSPPDPNFGQFIYPTHYSTLAECEAAADITHPSEELTQLAGRVVEVLDMLGITERRVIVSCRQEQDA